MTAMTATRDGLVDIRSLARLPHLHVAARAVVDGLQAGIHRSQRKGQSVDFADHRPYVGGDDTRHLDWKVLGRSDRLVIRRFEAESDLSCYLLVDGSGSMSYQGARTAVDKYRYASILAATLSWLIIEQHDSIGVQISTQPGAIHTGRTRQHFEGLCAQLEGHQAEGETGLTTALSRLSGQSLRRGLILVVSDCLDDPDAMAEACDRLLHRGHHLGFVWLLDPDETDLGCDQVSQFLGLEGEGELQVDPRALRSAYSDCVAKHRLDLLGVCQRRGIPLVQCTSADSPQVVLHKLLTDLQR